MTQKTKEITSELIRKEFDKNTEVWQIDNAKELIQTAKDLGLDELAQEMKNDLN